MSKASRYRLRYTFWLDHLNPDELKVADTIEQLKNQRSFATVVRDGIMLVNELRQGKIDLLLRLFPWVADAIRGGAGAGGAGGSGDMQRQFDDLKRLIMEQSSINAPPPNYPVMKSSGNTGSAKPLAVGGFKPMLPRFEDDDDEGATVVIRKDASTDAGLNFLRAVSGLQ